MEGNIAVYFAVVSLPLINVLALVVFALVSENRTERAYLGITLEMSDDRFDAGSRNLRKSVRLLQKVPIRSPAKRAIYIRSSQ